MSLNKVTLTWDLTDLISSGISATMALVPTAVLTDATDHVIIPEVTRSRVFTGGTGQLAGIIATDNSQITPAGWAYTITVTLPGGTVILGPVNVAIAFANGATQDLASLPIVQDATTFAAYMPLAGGQFTGAVGPAVVTLTDAATIAVSVAAGNLFRVTLGGNRALGNPSGGTDGQLIRVEVKQDASGSRLLSYGTAYDLGTLGAPVLSTAPGAVDVLGFSFNAAAGKWDLVAVAQGF